MSFFFLRRLRRAGLAAVLLCCAAQGASAQVANQGTGDALRVDLVAQARSLSMRDVYARSLYLFIRTNPAVLDNPHFFVSFLVYLMAQDPGFDCDSAFSSEFERNDYFTQAFQFAPQLSEAVASARISDRFDVPFIIDTGNYDFNAGFLPLAGARRVGLRGGDLVSSASASAPTRRSDPRSCAQSLLRDTSVKTEEFPWRFEILNPSGSDFPFGAGLQLSQADARTLFERFGRQLYAIVSYQVQAANNGEAKVQIVPTDGQLFGLANDAVVRVQTYAHPQLSQANYLDVSNPLRIDLDQRGQMRITLDQQGFRAVGRGTYTGVATNFAAGAEHPVVGSAAVGSSAFILRIATPYLTDPDQRQQAPVGQSRFLTLFGNVDFERLSATEAPVSGQAIVLGAFDAQQDRFSDGARFGFTGAFRDKNAPAPAEREAPAAPASALDALTLEPGAAAD